MVSQQLISGRSLLPHPNPLLTWLSNTKFLTVAFSRESHLEVTIEVVQKENQNRCLHSSCLGHKLLFTMKPKISHPTVHKTMFISQPNYLGKIFFKKSKKQEHKLFPKQPVPTEGMSLSTKPKRYNAAYKRFNNLSRKKKKPHKTVRQMPLREKSSGQASEHQALAWESHSQQPRQHMLLEDMALAMKMTQEGIDQCSEKHPSFCPVTCFLLLQLYSQKGGSQKSYNYFDFFLGVLKNKCYTQRRLLAHNVVNRIKLWGKHPASCSLKHNVPQIYSSGTTVELRQPQLVSL